MSQGRRVLIVSHDPGFARQVSSALDGMGCRLVELASAEAALADAAERVVALVVAEAELPGTSGYELCRQLKADELPPKCILVHRGESAAAQRGRDVGCDAVLARPLSGERLLAAVDQLLGTGYFLTAVGGDTAGAGDFGWDRAADSIVDPAVGLFSQYFEDGELPQLDTGNLEALESASLDDMMSLGSGDYPDSGDQESPRSRGPVTVELAPENFEGFDETHAVRVPVDASITAHFLPLGDPAATSASVEIAVEDSDSGGSPAPMPASGDVDVWRAVVDERIAAALGPGGVLADRLEAAITDAVTEALRRVLADRGSS